MDKSKHGSKSPGDEQAIPVEWGTQDHLQTVFANHMMISHQGGKQFYLLFGELPIIIAPPHVPSQPDKAVIKPVARVAIPVETMKEILAVMNKNVQQFEARAK